MKFDTVSSNLEVPQIHNILKESIFCRALKTLEFSTEKSLKIDFRSLNDKMKSEFKGNALLNRRSIKILPCSEVKTQMTFFIKTRFEDNSDEKSWSRNKTEIILVLLTERLQSESLTRSFGSAYNRITKRQRIFLKFMPRCSIFKIWEMC